MQDIPLTLDRLVDYAAEWHGTREIVSRQADGSITHTDWRRVRERAKQASNALLAAGVRSGDRVATLGWNSARHLEVWYGCIGIGAVLHTLNPRLLAEQVGWIMDHAEDRFLLADRACLPLLEQVLPGRTSIQRVVVFDDPEPPPEIGGKPAQSFEKWIEGQSTHCTWGGFDERTAAGLCYTSGTTGNPKGVLYSHRSNYIHALMTLQPDALDLAARDVILMVVPMYHANAWGLIYSAPAVGAKLVLPGQKTDGASLYELMESEGVTYASGVPTVWQMLLSYLRETGLRLSTLERATVGGSALSESIVEEFRELHDVEVFQGWGMTETSPVATVSRSSPEVARLTQRQQDAYKLKQGRLLAGLEFKLADEDGRRLPRDGRTYGRLMIRGPTIASAYFGQEAGAALDTDGYFDTGDVATIDPLGYMQITDRAKDVIKSGGEWISSVDVENIAVGHPKAEICAVIGVPHPKWDERPLLLVKLRPGQTAHAQEFLDHLKGKIASWWMPDEVRFVDDIPFGPTGKIDKKALRATHGGVAFAKVLGASGRAAAKE